MGRLWGLSRGLVGCDGQAMPELRHRSFRLFLTGNVYSIHGWVGLPSETLDRSNSIVPAHPTVVNPA